MNRLAILLMFLTLAFAACAPPTSTPAATPTPGSPFSLAGTNWEVVSLTLDGVMRTPIPGRTPTLEFETDGTLGGSGGCNGFGGNYSAQGEILSVTELRSTAVACTPEEVMSFEAAYVSALAGARLFEKRADQLNITFAEGKGTLVLDARP